MSKDFDFSCIPCAGQVCFPRSVAERKSCTRESHVCPHRADNPQWRCRCCDDCTARCLEQREAMKELHAR